MRISLLLQREPFGSILERTLSQFLTSQTGQSHEVRWYAGRPDLGRIRRDGRQPWLCNIYLNAIFVPGADSRIFDPIRREFSRSPVWWRRPAQSAYVAMASSRHAAKWLAQAALGISPALPNAEQLLVVAGNHKIRLLDHAKGVVYAIRKSGFPPDFMQREIRARQQATALGLPVAPLEAVAEDGAWFSESYVSGTPVNRLADVAAARRAVRDAGYALQRLLRHTMHEEPLSEYAEHLAVQARGHIVANHLLGEAERQSLLQSVDGLLAQLKVLQKAVGDRILTALTHGDFQPANILVNVERAWLIDWEYSTRRQVGYDGLVFALRSRFPKGLGLRLRAALDGAGKGLECQLDHWPGLEWKDRTRRQIHLLIFLLEELVLCLEENANSIFHLPGEALISIREELWNSLMAVRRVKVCNDVGNSLGA